MPSCVIAYLYCTSEKCNTVQMLIFLILEMIVNNSVFLRTTALLQALLLMLQRRIANGLFFKVCDIKWMPVAEWSCMNNLVQISASLVAGGCPKQGQSATLLVALKQCCLWWWWSEQNQEYFYTHSWANSYTIVSFQMSLLEIIQPLLLWSGNACLKDYMVNTW